MSPALIIAIVLVVLANVIYILRSARAPADLPDALFLLVDGAVILYVFSGVTIR